MSMHLRLFALGDDAPPPWWLTVVLRVLRRLDRQRPIVASIARLRTRSRRSGHGASASSARR